MPHRLMLQGNLLKICCEFGLLTGTALTVFSYLPIIMGTLASTAAFAYYTYNIYQDRHRIKFDRKEKSN